MICDKNVNKKLHVIKYFNVTLSNNWFLEMTGSQERCTTGQGQNVGEGGT